MRTPEETVVAFDAACRAASTPYAVIGGFAVSAWGQPRTTSDVDVLLALPEADAPDVLAAALRARGLSCDARDLADARRTGGHATIFDEGSVFHVDAKIARTPLEREQVDAAAEVRFHGAMLRVARAEDVIAFKLKFGSEQDLKDARSILARQAGRLDEGRLLRLADRLGVQKELERLRAETDAGR